MRPLRWFMAGALLGLLSSAAFAFQEQKGASPSPSTPAAKAPAAPVSPTETVPTPSSGPEIRIPGLGRVGLLPKFDLGLELLYGATETEPKGVDAPRGPASNEDENLRVRGTIKHRW